MDIKDLFKLKYRIISILNIDEIKTVCTVWIKQGFVKANVVTFLVNQTIGMQLENIGIQHIKDKCRYSKYIYKIEDKNSEDKIKDRDFIIRLYERSNEAKDNSDEYYIEIGYVVIPIDKYIDKESKCLDIKYMNLIKDDIYVELF